MSRGARSPGLRSGDEADGYDEVLCLHDDDLLDDDLRNIINKLPPHVDMTVICDSCFSGTVTRLFSREGVLKKRFREPKGFISPIAKRTRRFLSSDVMQEILLSGCSDSEYSYEDSTGGVFTTNALEILHKGRLTYEEFENEIHKR